MTDKNGKQLKDGNIIFYDGFPYPMTVRNDARYGWVAENPPPMDPCPQKIEGLEHRFVIIGD